MSEKMRRFSKCIGVVLGLCLCFGCGGGSGGSNPGNNQSVDSGDPDTGSPDTGSDTHGQITEDHWQACEDACRHYSETCTFRGSKEGPSCSNACLDDMENWSDSAACISDAQTCMEALECEREHWDAPCMTQAAPVPNDSSVPWENEWDGLGIIAESTNDDISDLGTAEVVVDANETPYVSVSYTDTAALMTYDGSDWSKLGGDLPPNEAGAAVRVELVALDGQDRPIVAFREGTGTSRQSRIKRWDGSAWEDLDWSQPSVSDLGLDSAGELLATTPTQAYRFTGSDWSELGSYEPFDGSVDEQISAAITTDDGGDVVAARVAIVDDATQLQVQRWDGAQWILVGGAPVVSLPDVTALANNRPFRLHSQPGGGLVVNLTMNIDAQGTELSATTFWRWDGQDWQRLGDAPCYGHSSTEEGITTTVGGAAASKHLSDFVVDTSGTPVYVGDLPHRLADDGYFYQLGSGFFGDEQISNRRITVSPNGALYIAFFNAPFDGTPVVSLRKYDL